MPRENNTELSVYRTGSEVSMNQVKEKIKEAIALLKQQPSSRANSIANTNLETAYLWLNSDLS